MSEAQKYYLSAAGHLMEGEELGRVGVYLASDYDKLRKQLDEANAAIGAKNARIHEYAERHLVDFAELEKLDNQLDEARELLHRAASLCDSHTDDGVTALDDICTWLERNRG